MSEAIQVTTFVAVDPATAFEVFTGEVDSWWRRGPRFRWLPDVRGTLRFEGGAGGRLVEQSGEEVFEVGKILAWEPAHRLVFELRGRNGEETVVDVLFQQGAAGTRVVIEHRGWAAIADDHPARHGLTGEAFDAMMGVWWGDLLVALRTYLVEETP